MKKKKIIIIVIIIIFLTLIYFISKTKAFNIQDDFIFFKLFGQGHTKDSNFSSVQSLENVQGENNIYIFKVSYKKTNLVKNRKYTFRFQALSKKGKVIKSTQKSIRFKTSKKIRINI